MQAIQPEFNELQRQVGDLRDRLSVAEGQILQLNRTSSDTSRQTIWQFVAFTISIGALIIGLLNYQTDALNKQSEARTQALVEQIRAVSQRVEQVEKNMNQRSDQAEKNINERFEDLKQEVRSRK
ncbi:MAG: hypothetical protein ABI977_36640 [Acidobacteriota bacterium]